MTIDEFFEHVIEIWNDVCDAMPNTLKEMNGEINSLLAIKKAEYANNDDALKNFNDGALIAASIPAKVANNYMLKHIVSIRAIIDDLEKGNLTNLSKLDEKIIDAINYLIIIYAIKKDMYQ